MARTIMPFIQSKCFVGRWDTLTSSTGREVRALGGGGSCSVLFLGVAGCRVGKICNSKGPLFHRKRCSSQKSPVKAHMSHAANSATTKKANSSSGIGLLGLNFDRWRRFKVLLLHSFRLANRTC